MKMTHFPSFSFVADSHGYDIAKWHAAKFTYVSPVWFNIQPNKGFALLLRLPPIPLQCLSMIPFSSFFRGKTSSTKFKISGGHDADAGWIKEVQAAGGATPPKIVPRFSADGWQQSDYSNLISNPAVSKALANMVVAEVKSVFLLPFIRPDSGENVLQQKARFRRNGPGNARS